MVKQLFESGGLVAWLYREIIGARFILTEQSVKSLIIIHALWAATPFPLIVFFAGLQTLPDELVEASMIDGATRLRPGPSYYDPAFAITFRIHRLNLNHGRLSRLR